AGFTSTGPLYSAYNGEEEFDGRAYKDVRVVAALYPNASHIIATEDSGVNNIADLQGKTFAAGAPGSVSLEESERYIDVYGLNDIEIENVGFDDATDLFRNKRIDALHYDTAVGTSGIVDLMSTADGKLINIDKEEREEIIDKFPMYYEYEIPAKTYEGQDENITTLAQKGVFIVPKDMSEDKVYELTKTLWENMEEAQDS